jgi:hypothetical protein
MSRTLVVFGAASGLMMSNALAQTPSSPVPAPATSSSATILNATSHDEWLASKLKGTAVIGADDQKIGEVADFLFDKMGHVKAFVVSIGGVLGIGAKEVALDMGAFHEMPATEGKVQQFKVSMTKEQLKEVPDFNTLANPPITTGAAPARPRPAAGVPALPTPTAPADKAPPADK